MITNDADTADNFLNRISYPSFDCSVPSGGYCWWYVDAISDDGQRAFSLIAFIGSVFSPYYRWQKQRTDAEPLNYCALNVALYDPRTPRWCMTERAQESVSRTAHTLRIGDSSLSWKAEPANAGTTALPSQLVIDIDERAAPLPRSVKGQIRVNLPVATAEQHALDRDANHRWWPVGAVASVEVQLDAPQQTWHGQAYADMNWGNRPIENDLRYWCWSRQRHSDYTEIHYDVSSASAQDIAKPDTSIAIRIDSLGHTQHVPTLPMRKLPKTRWQLPRFARSATPEDIYVFKTAEDTPFYSRSLLEHRNNNTSPIVMHESVSLDRFKKPIVQAMLPFRMPRRFWFS